MIRNFAPTVFALIAALTSAPAFAQEEMKAEKRKADYYQIVLAKFKPGMEDDAMKIIEEYFVAAADQAGTSKPAMEVSFLSGEWDAMWMWKMKDGLAEMEWEMSPEDVKWMQAMNDLTDGKAMEKWEEYLSMLDSSVSYIGYQEK